MTRLLRKRVLLCCCLGFATACAPRATTPERTVNHKPTAEERFAMRQEAMCDALAPRITQCAIEQARKNLTERELEQQGLSDAAFLRRYTNEIRSDCSLKEISTRQIEVSEKCTAQDSDCETFLNCLDAARKQAG